MCRGISLVEKNKQSRVNQRGRGLPSDRKWVGTQAGRAQHSSSCHSHLAVYLSIYVFLCWQSVKLSLIFSLFQVLWGTKVNMQTCFPDSPSRKSCSNLQQSAPSRVAVTTESCLARITSSARATHLVTSWRENINARSSSPTGTSLMTLKVSGVPMGFGWGYYSCIMGQSLIPTRALTYPITGIFPNENFKT